MATSSENTKAETNGVLDFPKHLRAYLQRMRDDELSHDVVFVVNNQRFPAHRYLAAAASPVLRSMLTNGMKETNERDIVLKEVDAEAWKAVLDYMYTGRMNICSVEKALLYLNCADWFQMEELVEVISEFIERKLDGWNCFSILIATDRPSLARFRDMAMKTIVENFHDVWVYPGFINLPFDVVLEVLRCDEVVVKSELDIFLAALRWIVWSGNSEMCAVADKACELIAEHTGLHLLDVGVAEADTCSELDYHELFECVNINKLSNADLQRVAMICRKLCKEAQTNHRMDVPYVREFGEKAVEKLVESDMSKPNIPVALHKRVSHHRNDMVFAFSHQVDTMQLRTTCGPTTRSQWFRDKRSNVMWSVEVQLRDRTRNEQCGYLSIFLYRSTVGSTEEEESKFSYLMYVEVGNKEIFSRKGRTNSTRSFQGGNGFGYYDLVPLSVLEGEEIVNVGVVLYFKAK